MTAQQPTNEQQTVHIADVAPAYRGNVPLMREHLLPHEQTMIGYNPFYLYDEYQGAYSRYRQLSSLLFAMSELPERSAGHRALYLQWRSLTNVYYWATANEQARESFDARRWADVEYPEFNLNKRINARLPGEFARLQRVKANKARLAAQRKVTA